MISAVAARKAALARSQGATPNPEPPISRQSSSQDGSSSAKRKSPTSEPFGTRKREKRARLKEEGAKQKKAQKKATKGKKPLAKTQRYFPAPDRDLFQDGGDVIGLGSDSDTGSDTSEISDVRLTEAAEGILSSGVESEEDEPVPKSRGDSMDIDVTPVSLSALFPHAVKPPSPEYQDVPLCTFQPLVGENVFPLSVEEVSGLKLPPAPSSSHIHSPASTIILLSPHESLCLLGTCNLTVLHGSVSILGSTLYPSSDSHRIYAPKSSPLPVIRYSFDKAPSLIPGIGLPARISIDQDFERHGAVLLLQELNTGVEGLGKVCRPFLNAFKPPKRQSHDDLEVPGLSLVHNQLSDLAPFILPPSWSEALERCTSTSQPSEAQDTCNIYLVKGPKNSGKSTFARTLLNQLLDTYERVAFLECDLGQSEFTPGGMVALNIITRPVFGPPFTHPTLPVAAHYIGASTPRSSPSHYLEAIQALLQVYRQEIQTPSDERLTRESVTSETSKIQHIIPLVVNTMGWSKGLGADLTQRIEEWALPTDVFTLEQDSEVTRSSHPPPLRMQPRQSFGAFNAGFSVYGQMDDDAESGALRTYRLDAPILPEGGPSSQYTAADHRTLTLLSYFHATFPSLSSALDGQRTSLWSTSTSLVEEISLRQLTAEAWSTSLPLVAMRPYEVDTSQALDRLIITGSGSEDVVEEEAGRVLNGAIVGLVNCGEGAFSHWSNPLEGDNASPTGPVATKTKLPYTRNCPPPDPTRATCLGLGLVRAVHPHHIDGEAPPPNPGAGKENTSQADLHLLTSVPPQLLSTTRILVKGEMELPIWGMLDFRAWAGEGLSGGSEADDTQQRSALSKLVEMEQGKVPYLQWGKGSGGAVGSEKRRVRRNLMRKGQM